MNKAVDKMHFPVSVRGFLLSFLVVVVVMVILMCFRLTYFTLISPPILEIILTNLEIYFFRLPDNKFAHYEEKVTK